MKNQKILRFGLAVVLIACFAFSSFVLGAEAYNDQAIPSLINPAGVQRANIGVLKVAPVDLSMENRGLGCFADWNVDGVVDTRDIIAFLGSWSDRDVRADINNDGIFDRADLRAFVSVWRQGCPPNPGSITTRCALADFNKDGTIDTRDLTAYLNVWSQKDIAADINNDGIVGQDDFNSFLHLWKSCTDR